MCKAGCSHSYKIKSRPCTWWLKGGGTVEFQERGLPITTIIPEGACHWKGNIVWSKPIRDGQYSKQVLDLLLERPLRTGAVPPPPAGRFA